MSRYVRIYDKEDNAKKADSALEKAGFGDRKVFLPSKLKGEVASTVRTAIDKGTLPERMRLTCTQALEDGKPLVSVEAPFGAGQAAVKIMSGISGAGEELSGKFAPGDPAPFSDGFNLPVLSNSEPSTDLISSHWSFSGLFGMGMLSERAAPLSSMFGMSTLTKSKSKTSSFGLPLLSNKAAPLSSMFGMSTLTKPKKDWQWSFGLPMLSSNPAPLSSMLGMKTLSDDR